MTRNEGMIAFTVAATLAACTPVVPPELASARAAYATASQGPAGQNAPAELHKAREALVQAERSFEQQPRDQRTLDLAYIAQRRAEFADAIGSKATYEQARARSDEGYRQAQARALERARGDVGRAQAQLNEANRDRATQGVQLEAERRARLDAEKNAADAERRFKEAHDSLTKIAQVKEEGRGTVITLSGSVLFASNQAELLPEARIRLDQVVDALLATKERQVTIEGYTDSRGSDARNLELSQRRAKAVRDYVVARGYDGDLVIARGLGEARPVANNASPEGRANNRRVEIIIAPKKAD